MPIVNLTQDNFDQVIAENDIVLIDFWASWCGPCMAFSEVYEAVSQQYPDIIFGKVDTEKETELAEEFQIRSIPFLMILRESVVVFTESGTMPETALKELIDQAKQLDMSDVKKSVD